MMYKEYFKERHSKKKSLKSFDSSKYSGMFDDSRSRNDKEDQNDESFSSSQKSDSGLSSENHNRSRNFDSENASPNKHSRIKQNLSPLMEESSIGSNSRSLIYSKSREKINELKVPSEKKITKSCSQNLFPTDNEDENHLIDDESFCYSPSEGLPNEMVVFPDFVPHYIQSSGADTPQATPFIHTLNSKNIAMLRNQAPLAANRANTLIDAKQISPISKFPPISNTEEPHGDEEIDAIDHSDTSGTTHDKSSSRSPSLDLKTIKVERSVVEINDECPSLQIPSTEFQIKESTHHGANTAVAISPILTKDSDMIKRKSFEIQPSHYHTLFAFILGVLVSMVFLNSYYQSVNTEVVSRMLSTSIEKYLEEANSYQLSKDYYRVTDSNKKVPAFIHHPSLIAGKRYCVCNLSKYRSPGSEDWINNLNSENSIEHQGYTYIESTSNSDACGSVLASKDNHCFYYWPEMESL